MKVVAYNIKDFEKELLAIANGKIHDLTLISNPLNFKTIHYAEGKEAVIVSEDDRLDEDVLIALKQHGISKIITRSLTTDHIDLEKAESLGMMIANAPYPDRTPRGIAKQTIHNLNLWSSGHCVGDACCCLTTCSGEMKQKTEGKNV